MSIRERRSTCSECLTVGQQAELFVMRERDPKKMSTVDLLKAIDFYLETGTNLTTHGQADDYTVGSMKMAEMYQRELERRENANKKEE